jgi:hypothetical protein
MVDPLVRVTFDPKTIKAAMNLMNFLPFLETEMTIAMGDIAKLVEDSAIINTWSAFQNPTGQLADSILGVVMGPFEADLTVNVPYANRLEWGYNAIDSLGRSYADPAEPYAMPAIMDNMPEIIQLVDDALKEAFYQAGG